MPATERAFTDRLPNSLYLDTDFLIAGLVDVEPLHSQARALLDRAARSSAVLYLSSLSWMEFVNVILKKRFRDRLSDVTQRRFQLQRWQDASIRRAYVDAMVRTIDDALANFFWEEISLTPEIRKQSIEYMADHGLRPQDAVHLASTRAAGCENLASFDEAFRRVDGLVLWNDLIHAGKPIRG